ncbi:GAF domain-containing protein [Rivularia sp. UHCC 0363]|uniref:sensor histidine kinase n=1 Tax=Rivularia sp. UHCC 0363 TaxID=3110244 RepID=UPI002B21360D|nr:GAF domain-containing protein [Rivularia sp. UHCC 0363]MEA5598377.1 GAF domain-containing protein [Rivularia sp. UHCC 0363]
MRQHQKFSAAEQQIFTLGRILQTLREEDNADVLIETIISYLKEQFDYPLIWIALYDRLNHILFGKGGVTPDSDNSYLQQRMVLSPGDLLEQVVIQQRPMGVADLRMEKRAEGWQEIATKFEIQGTIMLPIRHKDRCLGVVMLGSKRWGYLIGSEAKALLNIVVGELGTALFQLEMDLQYKQTKHPDEVLLRLLEKLRTLATLEQRLEAVVSATHQFIIPTRTNVYWFDPQEHYFWRRISTQYLNTGKSIQNKAQNAVTVEDLSDFYYALSANQLVWIGEGRSSLKSYSTKKLLKRLDVRSLLVAPILWQKDLLGFLAVEGKEPRIWSEADKNFVKGAAGLISLVSLTENMETNIKQIQADATLKSEIVESIYSDENIEQVLSSCAAKVLNRLAATRFLLLFCEHEGYEYSFFYQSQSHNRRPLKFSLNKLKEVDAELLERSTQAVGVENLEEDLRFFNWRSSLLEAGLHSILVSNCTPQKIPDAILMIANENNRSWTTAEKELTQVVAQQLGVIVRQWQLTQQNQHQQQIWQTFEQSLRILEPIQSTNQNTNIGEKKSEIIVLEQIAAILNCPLTVLLSWHPGEKFAQIIPVVVANDRFTIVADTTIPIQTDVLIHSALTTSGLVNVNAGDLPESTRQWLCGSGIGEVLVIALRTAEYEPTGVVLMADYHQRKWLPETLNAVETLVNQLAWSRRQKQVTQLLELKTEELQQLNWYKHRRFEDTRSNIVMLLSQMHDLGIPNNQLTLTRYQQLLRQLDNTVASTTALLKLEQWQLIFNRETVSIASLVKRSLKGVNKLVKQHKLWIGVHGLGQKLEDEQLDIDDSLISNSQLTISGDIVKIELILSELLIAACQRSQEGGRIDIWCRRSEQRIVEISITDNGTIHPQLLFELQQDTNSDILAPSKLKQPPMKHLPICKKLIKQLQGQLDFYQLPDGRIVSRLLLPLE